MAPAPSPAVRIEIIVWWCSLKRALKEHVFSGAASIPSPLRLYRLLKNSILFLGGAAVYRFWFCLWVAQRFTAAINALFSNAGFSL